MAPFPAWVGFAIELGLRQPERILHERRLNGVADERELELLVERKTQDAVEVLALGLAVIAIPLGLEMHRIHHVVVDAFAAGGHQRIALRVECAVLGGAVDEVAGRRLLGEERDHAARGVTVERRERTAQHFHAAGGAQIEL